MAEYRKLKEKRLPIPAKATCIYYTFSLSGFAGGLQEETAGAVRLVELGEMVGQN